MPNLSDQELAARVSKMASAAVQYHESEFSREQEKALAYYHGQPMPGDDEEGQERRSKVVSRDVAEVIDWSLPDLVKMFVGSDHAVEFDAVSHETEDMAEEVTEAVNHIFQEECDGFHVVHDQIKDGLLQKLGVVRVWWGKAGEATRQTIEGVDEEALMGYTGDDSLEIIQMKPLPDGTFTIRVEERKPPFICIEGVAPENFLIAKGATDEDDCEYIASRTRTTKSKLRAQGYDQDKIAEIRGDSNDLDADVTNRDLKEGGYDRDAGQDEVGRPIWVYDEFVKIDYDGDGEQEIMRVVRVGNTILHKEEVHEQEFVCFSPKRTPHRVLGESLADDVMDIQEVKTALWRGALDNMAMVVDPQVYVDINSATQDTINDLLNWAPGGIIRGKGEKAVVPLQIPDISQSALAMIEHTDQMSERRTGVSRYNQGLDADSLNKTATGVTKLLQAGQQRKDLVARLYAECLRKIFQKIFKLLIRYQKSEKSLQIKGDWKTISPRNWHIGLKARPNVGLGTGDKTMQRENAMLLFQAQLQVMPLGMANADNIYNSLAKLTSALDMGQVESYFVNPAGTEPPPPPPDPEVLKLEANKELEAAKLQFKAEEISLKMQADRDKEAAQLEADIVIKAAESEKEDKARAEEMQLEREKMRQDLIIEMAKLRQASETVDKNNASKDKAENEADNTGKADVFAGAIEKLSGMFEQMNKSQNDRFATVLERMEN